MDGARPVPRRAADHHPQHERRLAVDAGDLRQPDHLPAPSLVGQRAVVEQAGAHQSHPPVGVDPGDLAENRRGGTRGVGTNAGGHHVQVSSSTVGQPHPAPAQNPGRLGAEEPLVVVDAYVAGGPVGAGRIGVVAGAVAAAGAGGAGRPSGERHAEEESGEDLGEPSAGEAGAESTGEDVEARGVHRGFLLATDGRTGRRSHTDAVRVKRKNSLALPSAC